MHAFPHFFMPSVRPGPSEHPAAGVRAQDRAISEPGHHQVRVATGGRVLARELIDRELASDALPAPIDF